jgi:hypothetical protein
MTHSHPPIHGGSFGLEVAARRSVARADQAL